jgi:hypothetical protein
MWIVHTLVLNRWWYIEACVVAYFYKSWRSGKCVESCIRNGLLSPWRKLRGGNLGRCRHWTLGLYPGRLKPEFQPLNLAGKGLGRLNSVTENFASGRNWPNLSQLSPLSGVRQLKTYHAKKAGPEGHRFDPEFSRLSPLSWLSSDSVRHDGIHGVNWPRRA